MSCMPGSFLSFASERDYRLPPDVIEYDVRFLRQIPYAIGQFTVNEFCHELAFRSMSEDVKRNLSRTKKYSIALGSGIIAGFAAAILSHVSHLPLPF